MDIKLTDLENCRKSVEAEVSYEELTPHFEKALIDYRKKVQIPGFRKGKAPLAMVKKLYGDNIEYVALEDASNEIFKEYLIENKIDIIGTGSLLDMDYKPKEKLTFKVEFEVRPEIFVDNYKELDLTKTVYKIDDSLVEDEVQYMRLRLATYEVDGQAMDDEYMITFDTQEVDSAGSPIVGKISKDLKVYIGSKYLEKEFYTGLKNIREGEERFIDSKDKEGNPVRLQIKCTKVEKIIFPEFNEENFKKWTQKDDIKTEEDFRKLIKEDMQKSYENVSMQSLKNAAMKELVKLNDVLVPDYYTNLILDDLVKEYKEKHKGHKHEHEFNEEEFRKENRSDAIFNTKWLLIREKLIELEKIEVEDADYLKLAEENSKQYGIPADKLVEIYKGNQELKSKLIADKVLDFIIKNANVSEVEEIKKSNEN